MLHDICQVTRLSFLKESEGHFFQMSDDFQTQIRQAGVRRFMCRPYCGVGTDSLSYEAEQHGTTLPKDFFPCEGCGEV